MAHGNPHAVTAHTVIIHAYQYVAQVVHAVAETNNEGGGPGVRGNAANIFDRQQVFMVCNIFRLDLHIRHRVTRSQRKIQSEQHDSRLLVSAKLDRRRCLERFALLGDRFEGKGPSGVWVTDQNRNGCLSRRRRQGDQSRT